MRVNRTSRRSVLSRDHIKASASRYPHSLLRPKSKENLNRECILLVNMRIPMIPLSIGRLSIFFLAFSTLAQNFVVAIPHIVHTRQSSLLSALQLPGCAFRCFLAHLLDDGCANEADFGCHCAGDKLIDASSACIIQGCGTISKDDAVAKLRLACGKGLGGQVSQTAESSTSSTVAASKTSNDKVPAASTPATSASPTNSATTYPATIQIPATTVASKPTTESASTTLQSISRIASSTPTSTGTVIPLADESGQLSTAAKVGIGVSVAVLPVIAAVILAWYIRRLKRRASAAQQSDSASAIPDVPAMRGRQLSTYAYHTGPLSPSSPGEKRNTMVSDIGYGMVMKKRGTVLSILVEREDEDKTSVKEPVPGQREGLAPPLELDGEGTAIWELPTSITPRSRSGER